MSSIALIKKEVNTTYTKKIDIPQYLPKNVKPNVVSLCNIDKYSKLIKNINDSNVSEDEKRFLKFAASRHIVFNYASIADYYAHADKEMQELMEQSALVIIDVDDAIANGYVNLSNKMNSLISNTDTYKEINND